MQEGNMSNIIKFDRSFEKSTNIKGLESFEELASKYWIKNAKLCLAVVYCKNHFYEWLYFLGDLYRLTKLFFKIMYFGIFKNKKKYQGKHIFLTRTQVHANPLKDLFRPLEKDYDQVYILRNMKIIIEKLLKNNKLTSIEYKAALHFCESYKIWIELERKLGAFQNAFC